MKDPLMARALEDFADMLENHEVTFEEAAEIVRHLAVAPTGRRLLTKLQQVAEPDRG